MLRHLVLGLWLFTLAARAAAVDFSLAAGATRFQTHDDGVWFQRRYSYELSRTAPAITVGLRHGAWHLYASTLGRTFSNALADPDDANYNTKLSDPNPCLKKCLVSASDLPRWVGAGNVYALGITYRLDRGPLFAEVGAAAIFPRWVEHVYGWYPPDDASRRIDLSVSSGGVRYTPDITVGAHLAERLDLTLRLLTHTKGNPPYYHVANGVAATAGLRVAF